MNTRSKGKFYEEAACEYLKKHGVVVLQCNFRCRMGEIDIIAREGDCIIFAEVKYRKNDAHGDALAAVGYAKQKRICSCAMFYCMCHPDIIRFRYDVLAITDTKIEWIKNAFSHIGYGWQ